ncbi:MAG: phytanoyl-CoA dioxygenase family protein [Alphaproteobacteria bacterium]|nr:phytanoyl-CoA dioxygenase family protein [Alphaproteobacteria bacterium]
MLSKSQIEAYNRDGFIIVPGVVSGDEIARLRKIADRFTENARRVSAHDAIYDLEDSHTPESPRVRRIKTPHLHDGEYACLVRHPQIVEALTDLWGPNVRFDSSKLNMKSAGFGAPVEWHQDWAFYPHTNDDLAAVGVMLDDCDRENGPMLMIPGSHKGPIFDHHEDGQFCGAFDPRASGVDLTSAVPLTGSAGTITIHHVRLAHGSAPNLSGRDRRLLLLMYRAADAWPIMGFQGSYRDYDAMIVAGTPSVAPRLAPVPVRLPLPPADSQGSIYEMQKSAQRRFFSQPERAAQ